MSLRGAGSVGDAAIPQTESPHLFTLTYYLLPKTRPPYLYGGRCCYECFDYYTFYFETLSLFLVMNFKRNSTPTMRTTAIGSEIYQLCTKPAMI